MAFRFPNTFNSNHKNSVTIQPVQRKINSNEVLLNNFVEKDMQAMLRPLNVIPTMFITAKYQICDNFITSNTFFYNICTCLASVLCLLDLFFRVYLLPYEKVNLFTMILYWCSFSDFIAYFIGYMMNMFTNICFSHINVLLILRLQHVYKLLNVNKYIIKKLTFLNWAVITFLLTFYMLRIICLYSFNLLSNYHDLTVLILLICFESNILYASRLLHSVQTALKVWIENINSSNESEETVEDSYWTTMFEVYDEILKVYEIIAKTFKGQIICYALITFARTLSNVLIEVYLHELLSQDLTLYLVLNMSGLGKDIVTQIYLSKECENVYLIMEDLKSVCLLRLNERGASIAQRRMCKNVQRLQAVSFKKLSACGVYVVDGAVPIKLVHLLTSYVIVILQFALL